MENRYLEKYNNIIKIKIEGKNIDNYIKRIIKNKINIIKLIPISYKEVHLIIKLSEYEKLIKYKTTYQISIIDTYGKIKLKNTIKRNYILLLSLIIGLILIITLSKLIFSIDIIHEDKEVRTMIRKELENYGIKKYRFKKKYKELEIIEDKILKKNKDSLEWIEIIENGTKYIVRVEERKISTTKKNNNYQSIISKKNAIITLINATKGEKVKEVNNYVKKGETIISGYITHPDNTITMTSAKGDVYGEVWYKVTLDYPFIYQEEKITGRNKTVYVLNFINKRISLLDFNKYKSFKSKNKTLLYNPILNINLTKEKQYELIIKDEVYPIDIAITKAKDYITKKIKKDNPDIKQIKKIIIISYKESESKLNLKLFITAIEKISEEMKITEPTKSSTQITTTNE